MTNASSSAAKSYHRGIETWVTPHARIFRLHYMADPEKCDPAWINSQRSAMTDPSMWRQEFEIDFAAKQGQLVYQLTAEATLEPSFAIPEHWTRYFALDPHPRTPHGMLWVAVDNYGEIYVYRECWPSKVYGQKGQMAEDDNRFTITEYIDNARWLESKDNDLPCVDGRPESYWLQEEYERIWARVIDYAARGFRNMADSEDQRSIQQKYEEESRKVQFPLHAESDRRDYPFVFEDAIKDHDTGIEAVNKLLKPRMVKLDDGREVMKSRLHIFADKCPELTLELKTNRYPSLTPTLAAKRDPIEEPLQLRRHLTDNLRYLAVRGLKYIAPSKAVSTWESPYKGVAY